jgi:hypothetical protein
MPQTRKRSLLPKSYTTKTCGLIALGTAILLIFCFAGAALLSNLQMLRARPTNAINQQINNIYATMTMEAALRERKIELTSMMPTPTTPASATPIPPEIAIPTAPPAPANTLAPSQTPFPTRTIIAATLAIQPPPPQSPVCDCSIDYDCEDFQTRAEAQDCFNSCGGSPTNNWSLLDRDSDGIACEWLK